MTGKAASSILDKIRGSLLAKAEINQTLQAASVLNSRRMQALELFRPFPYQDEFLLDQATEILVQGGTRSGKSAIVAARIAAYVLNKQITLSNGLKVNIRPEEHRNKETGEVWVIGKQTNHSRTFYRLLFKKGLFPIVRDKVTGQWRALQPSVIPGDDKIPEREWKQAPPLIYPSQVDFGWESKTEQTWKTAKLPNGWTICFYPSSGEPKRGDPVHVIWIDEEIEGMIDYYEELQSRLSDYKGRIWWSSWAAVKCPPLMALYRRAEDQRIDIEHGHRTVADVTRHRYIGSNNPIIDEDEKRKRSEGWTEETRRARDEGHFITDTIQTYPEFDREFHAADIPEDSPLNDRINNALRLNNWMPGPDWCVDFIVDPGTRRPAGLWGAIPPPHLWYRPDQPIFFVYMELNQPRINPDQFALYAKNMDPGRAYHRFLIDKKAGDQVTMAASYQVQQIISTAFAKQRLRCQVSGAMFLQGDPNWIVRSMKLREMLNSRTEGNRPVFRVVTHKCPGLVRQLENNLREVTKEDVKDKRAGGQVQDVLDCVEYWAGSNPEFVVPPKGGNREDPGLRAWENESKIWGSVITTPMGQHSKNKQIICGLPG